MNNSGSARVATFIDKGGTGKTTTAAHLGVALSRQGNDVLMVDLAGKQGDLSKHFGVWETVERWIAEDDDWPNISTVFQDEWDIIVDKLGDSAIQDLIVETGEGPDLIPAHPGLDSLDAELGNIDNPDERYSRFDGFLDEYVEPLGYDVVLVDLPGITNNVTYNGLWATRSVIAPAEMGVFEASQLQALEKDLHRMDDNFDVEVELCMVVPNKVDRRTKLADEYLEKYESAYPERVGEPIPVSQDIRNAADDGHTIFAFEEPSSTADRAIHSYEVNAEELVTELQPPSTTNVEAVSDD